VVSPAYAAKKIASWNDVSDQKARESWWGKAVLDSVPEQTTIGNFAENRYQQETAYFFRCGSGNLLFHCGDRYKSINSTNFLLIS